MNRPILSTILSILFMSLGPTINKFALSEVDPFALVFYNSILCCFFVLPFVYKKILKINRIELKALLSAGLLNGLSMFFLFYGLQKSSPALVSMLNRSYVIFSILMGAFFLKEMISKIDWSLIVCATFGLFLFIFKKEVGQVQSDAFYGLASGLLFSLCNCIIKNKLSKTSEYIVLFLINLTTAIAFFFICLIHGPQSLVLPFSGKILGLVFMGSFLGSFLGLLLFYSSLKTIPFYRANLYRSISPVLSFILGLCFFPVSLSPINLIGLLILLLSFTAHSLTKVKLMKSKDHFEDLETVITDILPDTYKSVLVFIKDGKKWLMVKNKYRSWEFPGGHKEGLETIYETAKREAFEEAGVDIKNAVYKGYYRLPNGHTTAVVTAEIEAFHDIPPEFETEERKFVTSFPSSLSFNDAVYPWLVKNFC